MGEAIFGLIAAVIGSIISMANASNTNRTNQQIQRETNASNEAINERQLQHADAAAEAADQRTRALFNDLYSPQAKITQYKAAGLNPALEYGMQGASGVTNSGSQANTPNAIPMQATQLQRLMGMDNSTTIADAMLKTAQAGKAKAEEKNAIKDLDVKDATIVEIEKNTEKLQAETQNKLQEIQESIAKIENMQHQNSMYDSQAEVMRANAELLNTDLLTRGEINKATLKKMNAEAENYAALVQKNLAEAEKLGLDIELFRETYADQVKMIHWKLLETIANTNELNALAGKLKSEEWLNTLEAEPEQALQDLLKEKGGNNTPAIYKEVAGGLKTILQTLGSIFSFSKGVRTIKKVK